MSTTAAADSRGLDKRRPPLAAVHGDELEILVLAGHREHCAGVDRASGVLVRAWFGAAPPRRLRPFDLARLTVGAGDDLAPDPSEPEALVTAGAPVPVGRLTGRRAERLLRPLLHPKDTPLLGTHAPSVPFWARCADQPSVTLVQPQGPVLLRREPAYLACRFAWAGSVRELPCLDRRIAGEMDRAGQHQRVIDKRARLVVAFTPPIEGQCHKVVEAILPRL